MDSYEIRKYRRGKLIHIRLSPRTHQRLKVRVAELSTTLQRFVSRTIRHALSQSKGRALLKRRPFKTPLAVKHEIPVAAPETLPKGLVVKPWTRTKKKATQEPHKPQEGAKT